MDALLQIAVFCAVLFAYLHIHHHLKTSNTPDVYALDNPTKMQLDELCNARQPIVCHCDMRGVGHAVDQLSLRVMLAPTRQLDLRTANMYTWVSGALQSSKVNIRDVSPYLSTPPSETAATSSDVAASDDDPLPQSNWRISCRNESLLKNPESRTALRAMDQLFSPPVSIAARHDFLFGRPGASTPLCYETNARTCLLVTQGKITVRLLPPDSSSKLFFKHDPVFLKNISPLINVWSSDRSHLAGLENIHITNLELVCGQTVVLPAYWWYSIRYDSEESSSEGDTFASVGSSVVSFEYQTPASIVATLPQTASRVANELYEIYRA